MGYCVLSQMQICSNILAPGLLQIETELQNYKEGLELCKKAATIREKAGKKHENDAACARCSSISIHFLSLGLPSARSCPALLCGLQSLKI